MTVVFIPAPLRDLAAGHDQVDVTAGSVREVIAALEARFPGIRARLCEQDQLAPTLQVAIDQVLTRSLAARVERDSEVHFLPAIGGG